jgi:hypothetical protein
MGEKGMESKALVKELEQALEGWDRESQIVMPVVGYHVIPFPNSHCVNYPWS